jgi:uncharacterized membrane protein YukC
MNSIFFNVMCAALYLQSLLFGISSYVRAFKILSTCVAIISWLIFAFTRWVFHTGLIVTLAVALIPVFFLIRFNNYSYEQLENEYEKFLLSSKLKKIVLCGLIVVMFIIIPVVIISVVLSMS